MKTFFNVEDLGDLKAALAEAQEVKANRFGYQELGKNKTLLMIFFNNSLRTRLSTQKAAMNLGMNVIVLDVNQGAWKLETERGVIMDSDKPEHLLEAIPVMGCYCDIIGVRAFAKFESKEDDYNEVIVNQFISMFKDTSLVIIIGLFDLLSTAKAALSDPPWRPFYVEGYLFAALIYWVFCFFMSRYSLFIERRLETGHRRT